MELNLIYISLIIVISAVFSAQVPRKLLLISLDGFRWDYLHRIDTNSIPNFQRFIQNGVHSEKGLKNVFLTKTNPNHYSIVTGLYAESHGVVGNKFFDKKLNASFHSHNKGEILLDATKWFDVGAEPIWVTNQLKSPNHRSGLMMWPGNEAIVKGVVPFHTARSVHSVSNKTRIDTILQWFTDKENPINLGLLYFPDVDHMGHNFGPDSEQVNSVIIAMDKEVVGYLLDKLTELKLLDTMDIIITADHGMAAVLNDSEHRIDLDKYIDKTKYRVYETRPVTTIYPAEGYLEEIYMNLSWAHPHLHVYKREDLPEDFHYTHNVNRIAPIVAIPDENYWCAYDGDQGLKGEHGWSNSLSSMHPLFIAMGPSFKKGASVKQFNNVDIYPMMCHKLGLNPAPNNGSLDNVYSLLNTWANRDNEQTTPVVTKTHGREEPCFGFFYFVLALAAGLICGVLVTVMAFQVVTRWTGKQRKAGPLYHPVKYKAKGEKGLLSDDSEDEVEIP